MNHISFSWDTHRMYTGQIRMQLALYSFPLYILTMNYLTLLLAIPTPPINYYLKLTTSMPSIKLPHLNPRIVLLIAISSPSINYYTLLLATPPSSINDFISFLATSCDLKSPPPGSFSKHTFVDVSVQPAMAFFRFSWVISNHHCWETFKLSPAPKRAGHWRIRLIAMTRNHDHPFFN